MTLWKTKRFLDISKKKIFSLSLSLTNILQLQNNSILIYTKVENANYEIKALV